MIFVDRYFSIADQSNIRSALMKDGASLGNKGGIDWVTRELTDCERNVWDFSKWVLASAIWSVPFTPMLELSIVLSSSPFDFSACKNFPYQKLLMAGEVSFRTVHKYSFSIVYYQELCAPIMRGQICL